MKRLIQLLAFGSTVFGLFAPAQAAVETYKIDPVHSSVGFTIRRFVGKVPGSFAKFEGVITVDRDNFENSAVTATIEVGSVDTRAEKRDTHLKSPDFFDAAKFPVMTFKSKSWKKTGDDAYDVTGDLTIKDVTKEVVLAVKVLGFGPGMQGAIISGWEATTTLHRADFGINGPAYLGKMLGEDVAVTIEIEADLQK
jgi:polyisoprenoid-binding protein YceI